MLLACHIPKAEECLNLNAPCHSGGASDYSNDILHLFDHLFHVFFSNSSQLIIIKID